MQFRKIFMSDKLKTEVRYYKQDSANLILNCKFYKMNLQLDYESSSDCSICISGCRYLGFFFLTKFRGKIATWKNLQFIGNTRLVKAFIKVVRERLCDIGPARRRRSWVEAEPMNFPSMNFKCYARTTVILGAHTLVHRASKTCLGWSDFWL